MKIKLLFLFCLIQFCLNGQDCVSIITLSGKLSVKESLEEEWKLVTKKTLSKRKKVVFEWEDSLRVKSKDSIISYFEIINIEKYQGESYVKIGKTINQCEVFVVCLQDTITKGYFNVFISDETILKNKNVSVGDIIFIKIIPYTEYDHSNSLAFHGYNLCLTIGNLYLRDYNWRSLSIATSQFFEKK